MDAATLSGRYRVEIMQTALIVFIVLAALATAYVLVRGIINMASGKDLSGAKSNKLMSLRVAFQLLAIVFVVILLFLTRMQGT